MKNIMSFLGSASLMLLVLTIAKAQTNDPGQRMTPPEIDALNRPQQDPAPRASAESKLAC